MFSFGTIMYNPINIIVLQLAIMEHMDRTATTIAGIVLTERFVTIVMEPVLMDVMLVMQGNRVWRVRIVNKNCLLLFNVDIVIYF